MIVRGLLAFVEFVAPDRIRNSVVLGPAKQEFEHPSVRHLCTGGYPPRGACGRPAWSSRRVFNSILQDRVVVMRRTVRLFGRPSRYLGRSISTTGEFRRAGKYLVMVNTTRRRRECDP